MNWTVALRLGRVSNLPTVWTNVLTGTVLAGSTPTPFALGLLFLAISLFYVAGMYLNDAFDRHFDTAAYPQRPIPSGAVTAGTVFTMGFLGLGAGELLLVVVGYGMEGGRGLSPVIAGPCASIVVAALAVWMAIALTSSIVVVVWVRAADCSAAEAACCVVAARISAAAAAIFIFARCTWLVIVCRLTTILFRPSPSWPSAPSCETDKRFVRSPWAIYCTKARYSATVRSSTCRPPASICWSRRASA